MRQKESIHQVSDPKKREFLAFIGRLSTVAAFFPLTDIAASPVYLPSITKKTEQSIDKQEQRLQAAFGAFFPDLEKVTITNEQNIDRAGSVAAIQFWLIRFKAFLDKAIEIQQQSGITTTMYQDTVEELEVVYRNNIARTVTIADQGIVKGVELYIDAADGSGVAAELIHPFQRTFGINEGVSAINSEGVSTVTHILILKAWYEHNIQALSHGAEAEAVVMPIVAQVNDSIQVIENPSVDLFNRYLNMIITGYSEDINSSEYSQYKYVYQGEDRLGTSTAYPRRMTFLQRKFDSSEITDLEYQQTIEQHGAVLAKVVFDHGLTLEQAFILAGFVNHGITHSFKGADQAIIDAYTDLQQRSLIASPQAWKDNISDFSQLTTENLRANVACALKEEPYSGVERLTLEAFMVVTTPEFNRSFYDHLTSADTPKAKLFFQVEDAGTKVWYGQDVDVSPHQQAGKSLFYSLEIPRKTTIEGGLFPKNVSLEGKDMVVELHFETIFGKPLNVIQSFEIKGEFGPGLAEASADNNTESEVAIAQAGRAPLPNDSVVQVAEASTLPVTETEEYELTQARLTESINTSSISRKVRYNKIQNERITTTN